MRTDQHEKTFQTFDFPRLQGKQKENVKAGKSVFQLLYMSTASKLLNNMFLIQHTHADAQLVASIDC